MYKLYKLNLSELPAGEKYFYYSSRKGYVFLLTDKVYGFEEVNPKNMDVEERKWIFRCKQKINGNHLKKNEETYVSMIDDFMGRFEEELKKEVEPK